MIESETVEGFLKSNNIKFRLVNHKAVYTVEESLVELEDKEPIKNIFLSNKNKSSWYLVILKGGERLDMEKLKIRLNESKLKFASEENLQKYLGVKPGSVSVFCLLDESAKEVTLVLDQSMLNSYSELGFHPCVNTATIFLKMKDFNKVVDSLKNKIVKLKLG
ncbi:prolyl-tRNA synthetase associated domain-containing protein [Candidatus Saccharibacteria bacterium]|nr:prolyl-tRNA synthetase associated domain-containing protein [Candidatus Saccharibacteria bacterium]